MDNQTIPDVMKLYEGFGKDKTKNGKTQLRRMHAVWLINRPIYVSLIWMDGGIFGWMVRRWVITCALLNLRLHVWRAHLIRLRTTLALAPLTFSSGVLYWFTLGCYFDSPTLWSWIFLTVCQKSDGIWPDWTSKNEAVRNNKIMQHIES